ncbi:MAG: NAD(P)-dependent oxidoreductase [Gammaproteobacteria bacterium]|nr:NAD(P)-dependent oxidoreductase [Gammaproteobacteria bacterium]
MSTLAFIGLGVMGFPMAGHLARAGHDVAVYNRTRAKAERWVATYGGRSAATPREAAAGAEICFTCVGNDDDLRAVVLGADGAFAGLASGALQVDHSTTSATVTKELAAAGAPAGIHFLDAPVSGGQSGAEQGILTVMCGGDAAPFARLEPVLRAYARTALLLGPVGAGQLTKMVNQICITGLLQGLAEAMNFGQRAGLDMERVVAAISRGAAQSWQMDNRALTMCRGEFDFGFAVDWLRKDLGIVIDEARRNGASVPVTALVDELYALLEAAGGGRRDASSLIEVLRRR